MQHRFFTLALIVITGFAAYGAQPAIPSKSAPAMPSPAQRWAAAAAKAIKGRNHGAARGPAHPVSQSHKDSSSLPHWNGSFSTAGSKYSFMMVGTDPSKGSATTSIDTAIIPYRLVFSDGTVFDATQDLLDGRTPLQGALESPVFQNVSFNAGSVNLGTTQFADAMQRANFWYDVSTRSPAYHVLLSTPRVLPLQTVNVPAVDGTTFPDTTRCSNPLDQNTCKKVALVDLVWLDNLLVNTMIQQGIEPGTLPIHLFSEVIGVGLNGSGALGYHNAVDFTGNNFKVQGAVTYIFADWFANAAFGSEAGIGNTGTLGHEAAEWLNDPFVDNVVPYWQDPLTPGFCEQDFLEVGDPLESENYFTAVSQGFAYSLPDVAFLSWFERVSPSPSVFGQYSYLNQLHGFSSACPSFVDYTNSTVDYPGAAATVLTSINNHHQMAGYWLDNNSVEHSFVFDGKHFTAVNVSGSSFVQANKINDHGEVVGFYLDAAGKQHGFVWNNGKVATINYPGTDATTLNGLDSNSIPDRVGSFVIGSTTYGFKLVGTQFQPLSVPGGVDVFANGINNAGQIVGSIDNGIAADLAAFYGTPGNFHVLVAINDAGPTIQTVAQSLNKIPQVVGSYNDSFAVHGFLEYQGLWGEVDGGLDFDGAALTEIFDNNDGGTLVGFFIDLNGTHGFIATPTN